MAKQRPLRLRTCLSCGRRFYSRSNQSQYCCVAHQVKEWRARNRATHKELEQAFTEQESATNNQPRNHMMPNNNIYLEARKSDGAILSYLLERPKTLSTTVDYVQATQDELTYLSALEDHVFPDGTVASLDDLYTHRKRVQEAKATKSTRPTELPQKAPQNAPQSATGPNTKQAATKSAQFKAGLKPVRTPRK